MNAVIVNRRLVVQCKQIFRIVITYSIQWGQFRGKCIRMNHTFRYLIIFNISVADTYKIHLTSACHSDKHLITSAEQFKVNDIL